MPETNSEPNPPLDDAARVTQRNARYGLWLFAIYLILYVGFMLLNTFAPAWMGNTVLGVSIAVMYGLGLIVAALILALVYAWLCRDTNSVSQKEPGQ